MEQLEEEETKFSSREVRIAKAFVEFLKNQILYIRMLFLAITGFLLKSIYISLETEVDTIWMNLVRGLATLIVFVFFITTFEIEHWASRDKGVKDMMRIQVKQKSEIFRYFIDEVIPSVEDTDEKMRLGQSLSDMLSVVNIQDVKKDLAVIMNAQASFLASMIEHVSDLKNEMKDILFEKLIVPQEQSSDDLETLIDKSLNKSSQTPPRTG